MSPVAESQVAYNYTSANLMALRDRISLPRMSTYQTYAYQDEVRAIKYYLWNARVSKSLRFPLEMLEVLVRNQTSAALTDRWKENWHTKNGFLNASPKKTKDKLQEAVTRVGSSSVDRVIAGLSFGFWPALYSGEFVQAIWTEQNRLARFYPHQPTTTFEHQLTAIRNILHVSTTLRNRIGHLEPIVRRPNVTREHEDIIDLISWICTDTADWVRAHSTFPSVFADGPDAVVKENSILSKASTSFKIVPGDKSVREACEMLTAFPDQHLIVSTLTGPLLLTMEQLGAWTVSEAKGGIVDFDDSKLGDIAAVVKPSVIAARKCGLTELIGLIRAQNARHVLITETGKPSQKILGVLDVHDLM